MTGWENNPSKRDNKRLARAESLVSHLNGFWSHQRVKIGQILERGIESPIFKSSVTEANVHSGYIASTRAVTTMTVP